MKKDFEFIREEDILDFAERLAASKFFYNKNLKVIDIIKDKNYIKVIFNDDNYIKIDQEGIRYSSNNYEDNIYVEKAWKKYFSILEEKYAEKQDGGKRVKNLVRKNTLATRQAMKFERSFRALYESCSASLGMDVSYEKVFEDNISRLEFINKLFEQYDRGRLQGHALHVFEDVIEFVVPFINGEKKVSSMNVPKRFHEDEGIGSYNPDDDELSILLDIIATNKEIYEMLYRGRKLYLNLPNDSFNQNMTRGLSIQDHNMAHLLGLSEYEDPAKPDPTKNLLKKHFKSIVSNPGIYGKTEAECILNWMISPEGRRELMRINKITQDFIREDMKQNPKCYTEDGKLRSESSVVAKFKKRYKDKTGLEYPIINFSRWTCKAINTLNFLNMSNAFEVILDYNAPKGKTNEKDIFIVNGNQNKLLRKSDKFAEIRDEIVIALMTYASDRNDEESIKILQKYGIDLKKAEMLDHLNLMQAYEFVGAHGITVDDTYVDDKIVSAANPMFDRDVHLVGFNTVFTSGNSDISDSVYNEAHCDTSICLTVPELIGDYYQNGRVFFIDKFHSENGVIMVSSVKDEIAFLLKTGEHDSETIERVVRLRHLKRRLTEHFNEYQNGQDKIR